MNTHEKVPTVVKTTLLVAGGQNCEKVSFNPILTLEIYIKVIHQIFRKFSRLVRNVKYFD